MPQTPAAAGKCQGFKVFAAQKKVVTVNCRRGRSRRRRSDVRTVTHRFVYSEPWAPGRVLRNTGGGFHFVEEGHDMETCTYAFRLRQKARAQA